MSNKNLSRPLVRKFGLLLLGFALLDPFNMASAGAGLDFGPAHAFSFDALVERAADLSKKPYVAPPRPMPSVVEKIDYEAWGNIKYRPESSLFAEGPGIYPATFFHVGQFFQKSVKMHQVEGGQAREILYSSNYFSMPKNSVARKLPADTGFAGFRLQESRQREDWRTQDWLAYLGASYFRAIGALNQYGLSARGVTIDSAEPTPEEFPDFTEFYIEGAKAEGEPEVIRVGCGDPSPFQDDAA